MSKLDITNPPVLEERMFKIGERLEQYMKDIYAQREEILRAFVAKYGCQPHQCIQHIEYGVNKVSWWVTLREEEIAGD